MSSIDQQFIEYIVKSLVSKPDAVKVERRIDEKGVLLELTVDPEDLGRVIGKRGGTAQSLRILLRALGTKNDARYNLKIIDNGVPRPERQYRNEEPRQSDEPAAAPVAATTENPDDDLESAAREAEQSVEESASPAQTPEEVSTGEVSESSQDDRESVVDKTRRELKDFDDLDI